MLTNEPTVETTPQPQIEPMADGPVIVAPGAPGAVVVPPVASHPDEAETNAPGIDGEETIWEGHYSGRNFIGRLLFGGLLVALWIIPAFNWWSLHGNQASGWGFWTLVASIIVVGYWANLGYRYLRAYRGHHYRLTN